MPCELLIVESDRNVPQSPGRWLSGEIVVIKDTPVLWGNGELNTNSFVRFEVTNKTADEMNAYLQQYNRIYDMTVINGPDPSGFRRIEIENQMVNVSETLGIWTQEVVDNIVDRWNSEYPTANLTDLGFTNRVWTCEGTFTSGEADDFERVITEEGFAYMDKRKRWYITPAGMDNIRNAGGFQSGTSAQLSGIIRDGTLD